MDIIQVLGKMTEKLEAFAQKARPQEINERHARVSLRVWVHA